MDGEALNADSPCPAADDLLAAHQITAEPAARQASQKLCDALSKSGYRPPEADQPLTVKHLCSALYSVGSRDVEGRIPTDILGRTARAIEKDMDACATDAGAMRDTVRNDFMRNRYYLDGELASPVSQEQFAQVRQYVADTADNDIDAQWWQYRDQVASPVSREQFEQIRQFTPGAAAGNDIDAQWEEYRQSRWTAFNEAMQALPENFRALVLAAAHQGAMAEHTRAVQLGSLLHPLGVVIRNERNNKEDLEFSIASGRDNSPPSVRVNYTRHINAITTFVNNPDHEAFFLPTRGSSNYKAEMIFTLNPALNRGFQVVAEGQHSADIAYPTPAARLLHEIITASEQPGFEDDVRPRVLGALQRYAQNNRQSLADYQQQNRLNPDTATAWQRDWHDQALAEAAHFYAWSKQQVAAKLQAALSTLSGVLLNDLAYVNDAISGCDLAPEEGKRLMDAVTGISPFTTAAQLLEVAASVTGGEAQEAAQAGGWQPAPEGQTAPFLVEQLRSAGLPAPEDMDTWNGDVSMLPAPLEVQVGQASREDAYLLLAQILDLNTVADAQDPDQNPDALPRHLLAPDRLSSDDTDRPRRTRLHALAETMQGVHARGVASALAPDVMRFALSEVHGYLQRHPGDAGVLEQVREAALALDPHELLPAGAQWQAARSSYCHLLYAVLHERGGKRPKVRHLAAADRQRVKQLCQKAQQAPDWPELQALLPSLSRFRVNDSAGTPPTSAAGPLPGLTGNNRRGRASFYLSAATQCSNKIIAIIQARAEAAGQERGAAAAVPARLLGGSDAAQAGQPGPLGCAAQAALRGDAGRPDDADDAGASGSLLLHEPGLLSPDQGYGSEEDFVVPAPALPNGSDAERDRFLQDLTQNLPRPFERRPSPERLEAAIADYWKRHSRQLAMATLAMAGGRVVDDEGEIVDAAIIPDGAERSRLARYGYMAASTHDSRNSARAEARLALADMIGQAALEQADHEAQQRYAQEIETCFRTGMTIPDELLDRSALQLLPHAIQRVDALKKHPVVLINQREEHLRHQWDAQRQTVKVAWVDHPVPGDFCIRLPARSDAAPRWQVEVNADGLDLPEDGPAQAPVMPEHSAFEVRSPSGSWLKLPAPEISASGCEEQVFLAVGLAEVLNQWVARNIPKPSRGSEKKASKALRALDGELPRRHSGFLRESRQLAASMIAAASQKPGVFAQSERQARVTANFLDAADELWRSLGQGFESRSNNLYYLDRAYRKVIGKLSPEPAVLASLLRDSRDKGRSVNRAIAQFLGETHKTLLGGRLDDEGTAFLNRHLDVLQTLRAADILSQDGLEKLLKMGGLASLEELIGASGQASSRQRLARLTSTGRRTPHISHEEAVVSLRDHSSTKVMTRQSAMARYLAAKEQAPAISSQAMDDARRHLMRKHHLPGHLADLVVDGEVRRQRAGSGDELSAEKERLAKEKLAYELKKYNDQRKAMHSLVVHLSKAFLPSSPSLPPSVSESDTSPRAVASSVPPGSLWWGPSFASAPRQRSTGASGLSKRVATRSDLTQRKETPPDSPPEMASLPASVNLRAGSAAAAVAPAASSGDAAVARAPSLARLPSSVNLRASSAPAAVAPAASSGDAAVARAPSLGRLPSSVNLGAGSAPAAVAPAASSGDAAVARAPSLGRLPSSVNLGAGSAPAAVAPAASSGDAAVARAPSLATPPSSVSLNEQAGTAPAAPRLQPVAAAVAGTASLLSLRSSADVAAATATVAAPRAPAGEAASPLSSAMSASRLADGVTASSARGPMTGAKRGLDGGHGVAADRAAMPEVLPTWDLFTPLGGNDTGLRGDAFGRADTGPFGHGSKGAGLSRQGSVDGAGGSGQSGASQQPFGQPFGQGNNDGRIRAAVSEPTIALHSPAPLPATLMAGTARPAPAAADSRSIGQAMNAGSHRSRTREGQSTEDGSAHKGRLDADPAQRALNAVLTQGQRSRSRSNIAASEAAAAIPVVPVHTLPGFHADKSGRFAVPVQVSGHRFVIEGQMVDDGKILFERAPREVRGPDAAVPAAAPAKEAIPTLIQLSHRPTGVVAQLQRGSETIAVGTTFSQLQHRMLGIRGAEHRIVLRPFSRTLPDIDEA